MTGGSRRALMPRFSVKRRPRTSLKQIIQHRLSGLSLVPHHPFIIDHAPHDKHGPSKSLWEHVYMYLLGNGPTLRLLDSGDSPEETSARSSCDSGLELAMSHWRASLEGGGIGFSSFPMRSRVLQDALHFDALQFGLPVPAPAVRSIASRTRLGRHRVLFKPTWYAWCSGSWLTEVTWYGSRQP